MDRGTHLSMLVVSVPSHLLRGGGLKYRERALPVAALRPTVCANVIIWTSSVGIFHTSVAHWAQDSEYCNIPYLSRSLGTRLKRPTNSPTCLTVESVFRTAKSSVLGGVRTLLASFLEVFLLSQG
eukprot:3649127-Pyramimonas_sp.AAC.1